MFQHAIVLHDLGKKDEAHAQMERVIGLNPKHSDALNFVAYGMIDRKEDLSRALQLVRQALEIKPGDGYYLDTLGWIQFHMGDLEAAERSLGQAVSASGEDLVIVDHYGEVLLQRGKFAEALKSSRSVLQRDHSAVEKDDLEALQRIEQRVKEILRIRPELEAGKAP